MKKGFTLIELLVVIAIIAILAAILFPVFAQAREKARGANCLSNLKQLGTATNLYIDDYDETYPLVMAPPSGRDTDTNYSTYPLQNFVDTNTKGYGGEPALYAYDLRGKYWTWMDCIFPYVKNLNMYTCPSAKKGANGYGMNLNIHNFVGGTVAAQSNYNSFGFVTTDWQNYAKGGAVPATRSASGIKSTAQLVLYSDTYVFNGSPKAYGFCVSWPYLISKDRGTDYKISGSNPANRHNEGANFTFADGHAKFYKATSNTNGEDPFAYANGENRGETSPWWNPDFQ